MEEKKITIEMSKELFLDEEKAEKVLKKIRKEIKKDGDINSDSGQIGQREID